MAIKDLYPSISPSLNLDFARVKALDPRVTFSRASSATYYGTQTAKAEENLVLQSQDFNTVSWVTTGGITGNTTTAPDGTTTAESFNDIVSNTFFQLSQNFTATTGVVYTYSVFAKANAQTWIQLTTQTAAFGNNAFANFNLSTGAVGVVGSGCTASIVPVGNGWYRCIIVATAITSGNGGIVVMLTNSTDPASRALTYTGTGTGVYIWGAQLEQRSAVTAYTPTTTQPITNYIPVLETASAGVARFDHSPTTFESLGLLVEEQRPNLVTYSEDFANAAWTKTNATITANTIVAPDGTLTGDKLIAISASVVHEASHIAGVSSGTTYSFSLYAKAAEFSQLQLTGMGVEGQGFQAVYNLSNQTVTGAPVGSSIAHVGNGWYRCVLALTASVANPLIIRMRDNSGNGTFTGDGYSGIFIWGAQLEVGAFPTSYIKTEASQVTRSADSASITGSNFSGFYNAGEGTIYCEAQTSTPFTTNNFFAQISDNSYANRLPFGFNNASPFELAIVNSVVTLAPINNPLITTLPTKIGFSFETDNANGAVSGLALIADTSGVIPQNQVRIDFGSDHAGFNRLNGHIRKFSFYPKALNVTQLQALTS